MKAAKPILAAIAALFFVAVLLTMTACGESGFASFADYVTEHGAAGADNSHAAMTAKADDTDFSLLYYAEDEEFVFGMRRKTDGAAETLMLVLGNKTDSCPLFYTRMTDGDPAAAYAARGIITLSDPVCKKLLIADGENKGETDLAAAGAVNAFIAELFAGVDTYILADSGLRMSDLGFNY